MQASTFFPQTSANIYNLRNRILEAQAHAKEEIKTVENGQKGRKWHEVVTYPINLGHHKCKKRANNH